jgi:tRNA 2-thiouridine synthesizing protein A
MTTTGWDQELDARGLLCPLPVLKARKRLQGMSSGQVLRVLATDPAAVVDVPHFCAEAGHAYLGAEAAEEATAYLIRRK